MRVLGGGGEVELRTTGNISASESALAPRHSPFRNQASQLRRTRTRMRVAVEEADL